MTNPFFLINREWGVCPTWSAARYAARCCPARSPGPRSWHAPTRINEFDQNWIMLDDIPPKKRRTPASLKATKRLKRTLLWPWWLQRRCLWDEYWIWSTGRIEDELLEITRLNNTVFPSTYNIKHSPHQSIPWTRLHVIYPIFKAELVRAYSTMETRSTP